VAALRTIHVDLVFMGVHGMDPNSGFTTPNVLEADTDRALVESGRRLVVVADHTKWGVVGISTFARLNEADTVVTDAGLDAAAGERLRAEVREVVIAEVAQPVGARNAAAAAAPSERPSEEPLSGAAWGR
jgi:DeoR/GlpR family transcriptional regulator of sugar metabolism